MQDQHDWRFRRIPRAGQVVAPPVQPDTAACTTQAWGACAACKGHAMSMRAACVTSAARERQPCDVQPSQVPVSLVDALHLQTPVQSLVGIHDILMYRPLQTWSPPIV